MTIAIFWLLFAIAAVMPIEAAIYLFFVALSFGSVTVVPGQTTILPYVALSPMLIAKALARGRSVTMWDAILSPRKLGLLTLFIIVSIVVTVTAPILFGGTSVLAINALRPVPLAPSVSNITQMLYLLTSYGLCLSFYVLMLSETGRRTISIGLMVGGIVAMASGVIDMATAGTAVLAPVRTATYAIFEGAMVGATRRVIGFNTEASSFGALTLSFAAVMVFVRPADTLRSGWRFVQTVLAFGLIVMAALSTSSSAYIGLAIMGVLYAFRLLLSVLMPGTRQNRHTIATTLVGVTGAIFALMIAVLVRPEIAEQALTMLNTILFAKTDSESYIERGSWNRASIEAFLSTGGYGVGVGSTRASSWAVAVLSSTGILGAILMMLFIVVCLAKRLPRGPLIARIAIGGRYALFVLAIPVSLAGTLVDFGVFMGLFFAMMAVAPSALRLADEAASSERAESFGFVKIG